MARPRLLPPRPITLRRTRSRRRRRRSFGRGPPARQRTPVGTLRYGRTLAPPPRGPHGPRLERRSAPRGRVPAVPVPVPVPVPNRRPRGRDLAASVRGRGVRRGKGRGVGGDEGMARVGVRLGRARLGAMRRARRDARRVAARLFPPASTSSRRPPEDVLAMASRVAAGHAARSEDTNVDVNANAVNPPRAGSNQTSTATGTGARARGFGGAIFAPRVCSRASSRASRVGGGVLVSFHARRGAHGGGSTE